MSFFSCSLLNITIDCRQNFGPDFGMSDIHIIQNSNSNNYSSTKLQSYSKPAGLNDPNDIYFTDERNFKVKDIEVFQLE